MAKAKRKAKSVAVYLLFVDGHLAKRDRFGELVYAGRGDCLNDIWVDTMNMVDCAFSLSIERDKRAKIKVGEYSFHELRIRTTP